MPLTSDVIERIYQQSIDGSIPVLLDFENENLIWKPGDGQENGHLRVISDEQSVVYKGKEYIPMNLSYVPPTMNGVTISNASIKISTLDKRIVDLIKKIKGTFEITVISSFLKSGDDVFFRPMTKIKSLVTTITWDKAVGNFPLTFDKAQDLMIPRDTATKQRCPSLSTN